MEPKGNPNVPGDRKINKKTAASSATVKPNSKSPASSPIVSSALSTKSKAETALIHEEQGSYRPPIHAENPNVFNASNGHERYNRSTRQVASTLGYILQILFQTCAGAVLLTDGVFWFIIYPFLTSKEFNLDFVIHCNKAFSQAVFLLGETFLKSLVTICILSLLKDNNMMMVIVLMTLMMISLFTQWFPLFRISYFVLWTGVFVILQWIVHACVSFWWPYPFLDLSSSYAPLR
ncbi:hypothetical protein HID58_013341 [Brassica napus]|uniref:Uncharacterized protein n=1 Tax=Brassica napus TaxID=3708 RepID=A0ABQ7WZ21_BRANA|nr:hypothetical protein HID58_092338 [Brassica napus]KAH0936224.1 hypothetical protein HID58_013341 [Brassica napus]